MTDTDPTLVVDLEPSQVFPANLPHDVALRLLHERLTVLEEASGTNDQPTEDLPAPVDGPVNDPLADEYYQTDPAEREEFFAWRAAGRPGAVAPEPDARLTTSTTPQPFGPVATGDGPESRDADPSPDPAPRRQP